MSYNLKTLYAVLRQGNKKTKKIERPWVVLRGEDLRIVRGENLSFDMQFSYFL